MPSGGAAITSLQGVTAFINSIPRFESQSLSWPLTALDLVGPTAVERIEHGDAVGAGYFLTSFAATSVTALQVNSTKW
jgi:hypothetical protein